MKRRIYHIAAIGFWLSAISLFAVSCADDMSPLNPPEGGNTKLPITFTVDDTQDWYMADTGTYFNGGYVTRVIPLECRESPAGMYLHASVVNGINKKNFTREENTRGERRTSLYNSFHLMAYELGITETWGTQQPSFVDDAERTTSATWTLVGGQQYWPNDENRVMRFAAYSPANGSGLVPCGDTYTGDPYIDFTTPQDVTQQYDLMTGIGENCSYGTHAGNALIKFKHALTCVKFAIGADMEPGLIIDRISLLNVAQSGRIYIRTNVLCQANADSRTRFDMKNLNFSTTSSENTIIAPSKENGENETTMLMIPQTFDSDEQVIEMDYRDASNQTHTVRASLNGQVWKAGTTITYKISAQASGQTFHLTASSAILSHRGGTATFTVTSYSESQDGMRQVALPWRIIGYSVDNGVTFHSEKPDSCNWVGIATTSGKGGTEAETGVLIMSAQTPVSSQVLSTTTTASNYGVKVQSDQLRANSKTLLGTPQRYFDLSSHDLMGNSTLRNTANCYIVRQAGYYMLPLVYGNAIKNGTDNTEAYRTCYVSYDENKAITTPYIKDTATPGDCILVWQDATGLVSGVSLWQDPSDNQYYLRFTVADAATLVPGNAVVAVRDAAGTIMWSWHIWVTPIDVMATREVTNLSGYKYHFMPVFLGWCGLNGDMETYTGRSVIVKIQQSTGLTATFKITQDQGCDFTNSTRGYHPFYQWGRKDPLLPSDGVVRDATGDSNHHSQDYTTEGSTSYACYIYPYICQKYSWCIQYPHAIYANSTNNWIKTNHMQLWNTESIRGWGDFEVVKTIYDPSPAGFHIPASNAFTGFTKVTGNISLTTNPTYINAKGSYDYGYYFYTNSTHTETFYLPATGYLKYNDGKMVDVGVYGNIWCAAGSASSVSGGDLLATAIHYDRNRINTQQDYMRGYGFGVVPVTDY